MSAPSSSGDRVVPALRRVVLGMSRGDGGRGGPGRQDRERHALAHDGIGRAGSSQIAALMMDNARDAETAVLGALQQIHWSIHRGFCEYQSGCEERRQLAVDVGEITAKFIEVLCGAGFSEDDARAANVHELARPAIR